MTFIEEATAALALSAVALLVAGCGGGGDEPGTHSAAAPSATVLKTSAEPLASAAPTAQNPDLCE